MNELSDEEQENIPESDWIINPDGTTTRKKERKLTVQISRDAEVDSLHEDLTKAREQAAEGDQEAIEAARAEIALEAFDKSKEMALKIASPTLRSKIEDAKTPQELEYVLGGGRPAPAGKAQMVKNDGQDSDTLEYIYGVCKWPEKYEKSEVERCQKMRKTLIKNLVEGEPLKQMRQMNRTVFGDNSFMMCPVCEREKVWSTIDLRHGSGTCSICGYQATSEERSHS